jgi:hypothetical protein
MRTDIEIDELLHQLKTKLIKHHLHKLKLAYQDNKNIVFNAKYKIKNTRVFNFEIDDFTQRLHNINSQNITIYKFNRHNKLYKLGELSEFKNNSNTKNLGSPKIIIDLKKNTYKISMYHIISHYANIDYYNNENSERFNTYMHQNRI